MRVLTVLALLVLLVAGGFSLLSPAQSYHSEGDSHAACYDFSSGNTATSASYRAQVSMGQTVAGESQSASFKLSAGFVHGCLYSGLDPDADGVLAPQDNCQLAANASQANLDNDSFGDACDADDDSDLVPDVDEIPCGSDPMDIAPPPSRPERTDGVFAGTDDDGDTQIDEALPAGAANFDCDGDGYKGAAESGTPLCGNGVNDDDVVFGGSDDGVVDDGCPGGPAQVGAFSEAQFNIGLGDQDPCGLNGWPNDFVTGGSSMNAVTLVDLTSFLAPVRRLDASPGSAGFDDRWDLVPGRGANLNWIALNDLTALLAGSSGFPPMLGGVRAFGGPACPWPP